MLMERIDRCLELFNSASEGIPAIMEVCGTHTMAICRWGIRDIYQDRIRFVSGPGCPICVTDQAELDKVITMAREVGNAIITTFGDMMRVPGSFSNLEVEKARGADVRVVYSSEDAVKLAEAFPNQEVIFIAIGFETTAPAVALSLEGAMRRKVRNFSVFSLHKLIPPALEALFRREGGIRLNGLILPGHVSTNIGLKGFQFLNHYSIPSVIAGFEPVDILMAILRILSNGLQKRAGVENLYRRAVKEEGNVVAQAVMERYFERMGACWRGIGYVPYSGLRLFPDYGEFDAEKKFPVNVPPPCEREGCLCGDIITGMALPETCPHFDRECTPSSPVGPCMVSSEGACAAHYKYRSRR